MQDNDPIDSPISWEPSLAFLKFAIAFILAASATFLILVLVMVPDQVWRVANPLSTALVAMIAWFLLARGRIEATVRVLGFGTWIVVTGIATFTGGVSATIIIIYPMIILLAGWLIGTRSAIAFTLMTIAVGFCFALTDFWGFLPASLPTPPVMRWVVQSFIFVLSVVMIVFIVRSYRNRLAEVRKLGNDLSLSTSAVQARETDLNRAQAVAHVGSWAYDLATDTMRLSAETCRIFGLPEGTTGSHDAYLSRVHPEDCGAVESAWQAALKGGEPFDNEHRILVGKNIRWVRQIAELQFSAGGVPLRSVGSTQDITERKHQEATILAARSKLSATLDAIPDLLFEAGLDGRFHDYHSPRTELLVAPPADFLGKTIPEILPPAAAEICMSALREAHETGRSRGKQYELALAQGRLWFELSVSRKPLDSGQEPRFIALSRDITERKAAEQELRKSTAFRELLLEALPLPVFSKDTSGRYTGCNSAWARFIGATAEDIVGKTVFEIWPLEVAQSYHDRDIDLLNDPLGPQTYETRIAHADGTTHNVIMHKARMVDEAGNPIGILGVITDITEIRRIEAAHDQIEAQLRESQKMEALGTLAGGVAHDFNNIVATIMGNVELARQDVGPAHAALESLAEIRKASNRAKDLVQQILAFGRRQALAREVIALAPVVTETARLLRSTLPAGVNLSVECAPEAPAVLANSTQIEQVLLNLCTNAWQAMQGQERPATIEIRLAAHTAGGAPYKGAEQRSQSRRATIVPGRYACLTVRDSGPGMDTATAARIFEPFFTTKPVGKGTGLGLSVVHGILQEHQANIEVQSASGVGTTFRVYFPAAPAPAQTAPARAPNRIPALGRGKHILYVDDDESIVYLMKRLLERQGYRVSGYTDAQEALAAARADPLRFDLAVTDFNMPGMSGLEVASALREIRADLPVALASGYITEELRSDAPAAGVIELIYKPNTVDELCETVARLTDTLPT